MAATDQTAKLVRDKGLPKNGDQNHYFGFDQVGGVWALQWSKEHDAWTGTGFQNDWPASVVFRGDAKDHIVSYVGPVHLIQA